MNIEPADCSITANDRAKTIKTNSLILNFYKTRTIQVQGSDCQNVKVQRQSILNATKANSVTDDDDGERESSANDKQLLNPSSHSEGNEDSDPGLSLATKPSCRPILKEKLAKSGRRLH